MQFLRKLTAKTVGAPFVVYGQALGTSRGESQFGPWVALTGTFKARKEVPMDDGTVKIEEFASAKLFVPDQGIAESMAGQIEAGNSLTFAFRVENSSDGKGYAVMPLDLSGSTVDPIKAVEGALGFAGQITDDAGKKRTKK